ncbi:MAG: protein translocase subunit SecD [Azospirillaceae bacterium]|nr:protein translocase subunit SecD [Azospirillaceae bacterium]
MLYFSKWKIWGIIAVCVAAILFTIPNFLSKATLSGLPGWVPQRQINLGLDLRGGSYLLLEIDTAAVIRDRLDTATDAARTALRTANIGYTELAGADRSVTVHLRDAGQADAALTALGDIGSRTAAGQPEFKVDSAADGKITLTLTDASLTDRIGKAVEQSIEIVRRRIDETGVNEPQIARQGADRILVQLPGVQDPDRIKRLLGQTAKMTFRLLDPNGDAVGGKAPPGSEILQGYARAGTNGAAPRYVVRRKVEVDGADLTDARAATNSQSAEWVVSFEFNSSGARRFAQVTQQNVGRPFAIVLDDKVLSAPVIREPITGGRGQISGNFTAQSANDLAVLLRAGALPAPLQVIEERSVGPDLGADSIRAGILSCLVGLVLVATYMIIGYGIFGLFADLAVIVNLFMTLAALSLLQATLTLPGIAGILLMLGMSVDANILINERIREETRRGRTPFAAMEAGFKRAFSTILDSNLTTLIKMIILFLLGSGTVKGFAVTISLGIIISLFTATVLVRLMMVTWLRRRRPAMLPV